MSYKTVSVRALPRRGFSAFFRGGHRWPETGRVVNVSEELYRVLRAEPMVAVEPHDGASPEDGALELVDNYAGDREHNASASVREENARLHARAKVLEAAAENERLRARIAELEREAAQREHERLQREQEAILLARETASLADANAALRDENVSLQAEAPPAPTQGKRGKHT